jgi:hypothetical protein
MGLDSLHAAPSPPQVRQGAGLLLKNNLKQQFSALPEPFKAYIKVRTLATAHA